MLNPIYSLTRKAALLAIAVGMLLTAGITAPAQAQTTDSVVCTFNNAILDQGQDPSVAYLDGFYYLVQSSTTAGGVTIRKSARLSDLGAQTAIPIFEAPRPSAYGYDLWAPELLYLQGRWYIYFAGDDAPGNNDAHRMYVLRAKTQDPTGDWEFMGALFKGELDKWSIDLTAFEYKDNLYAVWSGSADTATADFKSPQVTYIARMRDPLTVETPRVLLIMPDQPYENSVQPIAEGPEAFIYDNGTPDTLNTADDVLTIIYSADASWTRQYKLAALHLTGDDLLDPRAWTKLGPVFVGDADPSGDIFGVGHNSAPVPSPDGKESWLVYHAKLNYADSWADRAVTAKSFTWNADGTPNFGSPTDWAVDLALPSGEPCGLALNVPFDSPDELSKFGADKTIQLASGHTGQAVALTGKPQVVVLGKALIDTRGSYTVSAWIKPDATLPDGSYAVISQEGGIFSAFTLGLVKDSAGTRAMLSMNDAQGKVIASAEAPFTNGDNWTQLIGVRNALDGTIRLYIDGKPAASAPFTADWRSAGSTVVGATRIRGQRANFFLGAVDDVQIYNGAVRVK